MRIKLSIVALFKNDSRKQGNPNYTFSDSRVRKKERVLYRLSLDLARQHLQPRASPPSKIRQEIYDKEVERSLRTQKDLEQSSKVPFDKFLADYVTV